MHALSDPTRRDIVAAVLGMEYSVSALARRYPMSFAAVQKHVAVLESAQLVRKRRHGREQLVGGNVGTIRVARALLDDMETLWRQRVAQMHDVLGIPSGSDNDERSSTYGSD
jgi:DNA-binding transcriptional ArsR family regulator